MSNENNGFDSFSRWGFRNFVDGVKDLILCMGIQRRCLFAIDSVLLEKIKQQYFIPVHRKEVGRLQVDWLS
jgi:hypothetical protein